MYDIASSCIGDETFAHPAPYLRPAQRRATGKATQLADCATRIAAREEQALSELFEATVGRVHATAFHILGDPAAADEVVSEVYFQFWREIDRYDPARSSVQVWLLVICRSRALDARRRLRDESRCTQFDEDKAACAVDESCDPPDLLAAIEECTLLNMELASLTACERQLLALAFFRGCTHEEIAAREGMPLGTVKSHIRRGLLRLRRALQEQGVRR